MHIGDETFNGNICSSMILSRDMTNTIEEWPREVEQSLLFHGVPVPDNESFYTKVGDDDGGDGDGDGGDDGDDDDAVTMMMMAMMMMVVTMMMMQRDDER